MVNKYIQHNIYVEWLLLCIYVHSLQSIAKSLYIYGAEQMHSVGFVKSVLEAVFPEVEHLNHWRLRVVLNILKQYISGLITVYIHAAYSLDLIKHDI